MLDEKGIVIIQNACIIDARINSDQKQELVASDGRAFPFDVAIWCTQVRYYNLSFSQSNWQT
jgi:hypothetical protein